MSNAVAISTDLSLENIVTNVVKIPGVKVNREKFLAEEFSNNSDIIQEILENGPIQAGIEQDQLNKLANKLIMTRTSQSSITSFAAGLPGGWAMAATIPADIMQFFGMSLRLAQEISYLYGAQDLWKNGEIDDETVRNQLILYCGVMFGVSSAAAGVRVLSAQLAKTALKKLPQKALTKTFWYPVIKQIGKIFSIKVTKTTVAHGFSKAIPVIGGVLSGGLNFASMLPMARRLHTALDAASFNYTEEALNADLQEIENLDAIADENISKATNAKEKLSKGVKNFGDGVSGFFGSLKVKPGELSKKKAEEDNNEILATIEKLANLKEMGVLTEEEFNTKKAELLSRL